MKGKQAVMAERQRTEAAYATIDRLTSQLAEAKLRAKMVETKASQAERLQRMLDERNNDALLKDALRSLVEWEQISKEDRKRRLAALPALSRLLRSVGLLEGFTSAEMMRFIAAKAPELLIALAGTDAAAEWEHRGKRTDAKLTKAKREFTDAEKIRLARVMGEATVFRDYKGDPVQLAIDTFDAKQAGFSAPEIYELLVEP